MAMVGHARASFQAAVAYLDAVSRGRAGGELMAAAMFEWAASHLAVKKVNPALA